MNPKLKGISLIVLVITIIVMIILASSIIMTLSNSNVISKAKEGKAKNDISTLKQHWQRSYSEALLDTGGVNPTVAEITTRFGASNIPAGYEITETGMRYVGSDAVTRAAAIDLNIEIYTDEKYFYLASGVLYVKEEYVSGFTYSIPNIIAIPATINGVAVTSIGDNAFIADTTLTSLILPNSVTSIGSTSFSDCTNLASVTLSSNLVTIGTSAFNSCTYLASVTLPSSLTTIGSAAFRYCNTIKTVTIPSSVTTIGSSAFNSCASLASIRIQKATNSISGSPWGSTCTILWNQ